MTVPSTATEDLLRALAPRVLGAMVRRMGGAADFADAEDAVQEALIAAATQWPRDGEPDDPRAWLVTVAARKHADRVRSDVARRAREDELSADVPVGEPEVVDIDDSLAVLFRCCHPVLAPSAAIPLTLRAVGGLSTAAIARVLLVGEATVAQRISRAKQRLRTVDEPFRLPTAQEWPERLRSVLHVLYVLVTAGHASGGETLTSAELSDEAIRLARLAAALLPDDPEVGGLLALMLLTEARRPARTGSSGELVPLDEQDRSRWDRALLAEGMAVLAAALRRGRIGEYQLQAAVAACHGEAARVEDTDWPRVAALYELLERITASPVVTLNRAVAVAMVDGPAAGLALAADLDEQLRGSHRLAAVRAHLHERAGDRDVALVHYRDAAARTTSVAERDHLLLRAARLQAGRS